MYVPESARAALNGPTPVAGSVDSIGAAATFVSDAADDCTTYRYEMRMASLSLSAGRSRTLTRLRYKSETTLPWGAETLESSLDAAETGLQAYGSEVDRIHEDARRLLDRVDERLGEVRVHAATVEAIASRINRRVEMAWNSPPSGELPTPSLDSLAARDLDAEELAGYQERVAAQNVLAWDAAVAGWWIAHSAIQDERISWNTLYADRIAAEEALLATLGDTALGRLIQASETGPYTAKATIAYALSGELWGENPVGSGRNNPEVEALLEAGSSPEELAEAWERLALSAEDIERLPLETLAQLAETDGLPGWVRDIASRAFLQYAITSPEEAYAMLGFQPGDETTLSAFRAQTLALFGAWHDSLGIAPELSGSPTVQLLGVGNHDGQFVAAISLGDVDTASRVGVNVPGMNSGLGGIQNGLDGGEQLFRQARNFDANATYALVTWFGYNSPDASEVMKRERAEAGAERLVGFLNGIDASRARAGHTSGFTVFAHSYGSTTAALALASDELGRPVDSFTAYGSAGLTPEIEVKPAGDTTAGFAEHEIRAERVFATSASGDGVAWIGRSGNRHDPRDLGSGVTEFSAEASAGRKAVTVHSMYEEDGKRSLANLTGSVGYLSAGTGAVQDMGRIFATGDL